MPFILDFFTPFSQGDDLDEVVDEYDLSGSSDLGMYVDEQDGMVCMSVTVSW